LDTKIRKIPVQERQFRVIDRQQKVMEALYLYLLQREKKVLFLYRLQNPKLVLSIRQILIVHLFSSKRHDLFWWFSTRITASFRVIYTDDLLDTKIKSRLDIEGKRLFHL
jgi:hypothetical protein